MANGTDIGQLYLDWLDGLLKSAFYQGDVLGLGDPSQKGGGGWFDNPSKAYLLLEEMTNKLREGESLGMMPWYSTPPMSGVDPFIETYQNYYAQENQPWLEGGQLVAGGQILRTQDGRYVDPNTGIEYDLQTALTMIQNWLGTKDDDSLTRYEEESLNLALQELAWDKEQYGTLSASDKASLQLARDELQQTRNEWLAGLQAQPADWIERWYAERLPAGTQMGETYPWGEPVVGTDAWSQKMGFSGATPSGGTAVPAGVAQATGGVWQPTSQGGNPWITAQGTPDIEAINAWTGRQSSGVPPENISIGSGYPNLQSYEQYMRQYPNSDITPEAYYSQAGAYEIAAYYNPAYAYGAQQAALALKSGEITNTQYQAIKAANFVDAQGNPLAPQNKWAKANQATAAGWAQAQSPAGYLSTLQAQGIPPSQWASRSKNPDVSAYLGGAAEALAAPLPTPEGKTPWSSYLKGGSMYKAGSAGSWGAAPSRSMPAGVSWGSIY